MVVLVSDNSLGFFVLAIVSFVAGLIAVVMGAVFVMAVIATTVEGIAHTGSGRQIGQLVLAFVRAKKQRICPMVAIEK